MRENYLFLYFLMNLKAAWNYPNFADYIAHNGKNLDEVVEEIFFYYKDSIKGASPDAYMDAIELCLDDETYCDGKLVHNYDINWEIDDLLEIVEVHGYLDRVINS